MFILTVSFSYAPATLPALCIYCGHITVVFMQEKVRNLPKDLSVAYCARACMSVRVVCVHVHDHVHVHMEARGQCGNCSSGDTHLLFVGESRLD